MAIATDELVHSTRMTVHVGCAARLALRVHVPDRVRASDRCGVCDPRYSPWSDVVARDFGVRDRCCVGGKR